MADADAGEFWVFFGGFAPLPRKAASSDDNGKIDNVLSTKLLRYCKSTLPFSFSGYVTFSFVQLC